MKVRAYLALMAAAILVPATVFSAVSLATLLDAQREAAFRAMQETARLTSLAIDRELSTAEAELRILSTSKNLENGDFKAFYDELLATARDGHSWNLVLDESGQQLNNTRLPLGASLPPPADPARVRQVLAEGKPRVSDLLVGPNTKKLLAVVDLPVVTAKGKRYVLSEAFPASYFERTFPELTNRPGWLLGVFDRQGRTVARNRGPENLVGEPPRATLLEAIRTERRGAFRNRSRDNEELYTVVARSAYSGWSVAVGVPVAEIESAARSAVMTSALGLVAALACGAVFATVFSRSLFNAISGAAQSAAALGRGEMPVRRRSRISELEFLNAAQAEAGRLLVTERENRLRAEMERERLQRSEQDSHRVIEAERAKNFSTEQEARKEAEMQNRLKDQFLAMLGHELRNPLSAISGAVTILDMPNAGEERGKRARAILKRQTEHLSHIVDDLLDLGRMTTGKLILDRHQMDLADLVQSFVSSLQATGRTEGYQVSVATEPAVVDADRTRIEQVVSNLVVNALKYTPRGGDIEISVSCEPGWAVLRVRDSGIGIAPELLPRLFELFVQGEASLDRSQGGLGIGLALVSQLVHMHGGIVEAASDGPGAGSLFTVRLPLVGSRAECIPISGEPALSAGAGQRVLLIDDNEDARQMVSEVLQMSGFEVLGAANGYDGLRIAQEQRPDAAIVDIGLPGINGFEVARLMRAQADTSAIRLLALTGYGQASDRQRALDAGFERHFAKPVDINELIAALRRPREEE